MELIRLDSNRHPNEDKLPDDHGEKSFHVSVADKDAQPEDAILRVSFDNFGRGKLRRPNFAVEVSWLDVKRFVREFIKLGHPDAAHLNRMIRLAEAIEQAGWSPNDPPNEDFWDILPQSN